MAGATVKYTATFTNDDSQNAVNYTNPTLTADGSSKSITCTGGTSPLSVPASGSETCTVQEQITAGEVTAGLLSNWAMEFLDSATSIATGTLTRSNIKFYKTALQVALDAGLCSSVPSMPSERLLPRVT